MQPAESPRARTGLINLLLVGQSLATFGRSCSFLPAEIAKTPGKSNVQVRREGFKMLGWKQRVSSSLTGATYLKSIRKFVGDRLDGR